MSTPVVNRPRRGYTRSTSGLIGALIAVFALIAFVWGLSWFQRSGHPDPTPTISYRAALANAQSESPFPLLAPSPAPDGLRATSVNWDGVGPRKSWQLGFLNSQQEFVGLYQGNGPAAEYISDHTPASHPGTPEVIGGQQWLTLTDAGRSETAFVRTSAGVTVIVTGNASRTELVAFIRSLH